MSDMKCPFCGEKLQQTFSFNPKQFWCSNYYDHKHPINMQGTKELWQELITTRKALDVAIGALKELRPTEKRHCFLVPTVFTTQRTIDDALKQINEIKRGK